MITELTYDLSQNLSVYQEYFNLKFAASLATLNLIDHWNQSWKLLSSFPENG